MEGKSAIESICRTIWRNIESAVDSTTRGIRDGVGREVMNPFTAKPTRLSVPRPALRVRELLQRRGVELDADLVSALNDLVRDTAVSSHFALLTDFDGEGWFEGDLKFRIQTLDGDEVPSYLHEVFYEYKPTLTAEPE